MSWRFYSCNISLCSGPDWSNSTFSRSCEEDFPNFTLKSLLFSGIPPLFKPQILRNIDPERCNENSKLFQVQASPLLLSALQKDYSCVHVLQREQAAAPFSWNFPPFLQKWERFQFLSCSPRFWYCSLLAVWLNFHEVGHWGNVLLDGTFKVGFWGFCRKRKKLRGYNCEINRSIGLYVL